MQNKEQIIAEFNSRFNKNKEEYLQTDGRKYMLTLPIDAYGQPIDVPKEKFPEHYKNRQEHDNINKEFNEIVSQLAKYKEGDIVVVGCENSIEFGMIANNSFAIEYTDVADILYYVSFDKDIDNYKYGSDGGYFGGDSCTLHFYEKDILMKVSPKEMKKMKKQMRKMPIERFKIMYPELFPIRK